VLLRSSAKSRVGRSRGSSCWFCWRIKTREPSSLPSAETPPWASPGELEAPLACPCVGPGRDATVLRQDAWKARLHLPPSFAGAPTVDEGAGRHKKAAVQGEDGGCALGSARPLYDSPTRPRGSPWHRAWMCVTGTNSSCLGASPLLGCSSYFVRNPNHSPLY
jgi:hypothetical protein